MVFAETERLILRSLNHNELPRLVSLLDVWEVVKWLSVVPYPYTMKDAEEFYKENERVANAGNNPEFFVVAIKPDNLLIGGIGLHPPRSRSFERGDVEIGYWLSHRYWGNGYMTEGARVIAEHGISQPTTRALIATTAPNNVASQNVLMKLGMQNLGLGPRDYTALRGGNQVVKWQLTRRDWEQNRASLPH